MTTIISGSRTISDCTAIHGPLYQQFAGGSWDGVELIFGDARGVDECAKQFAEEHDITYTVYEADWEKHGKAAGPKRNAEMVADGDELIAIWDGESTGTKDAIDRALAAGLDVHVYQRPDRAEKNTVQTQVNDTFKRGDVE